MEGIEPVGFYVRIRKRKRVFQISVDADYGENEMNMRDGGKLRAVIINGKKYFEIIRPENNFPETPYEKERRDREKKVKK